MSCPNCGGTGQVERQSGSVYVLFDCSVCVPPPSQRKAPPPLPLKDTNPKDGAATARVPMSLFPETAIIYGALALTEGDLKYGGHNWRCAGVRSSVYIDALKRHTARWIDGEEQDPATKVPHLASMLACVAILIDATEAGNMTDDRPPFQATAALLTKAETVVKHLQGSIPRQHARHTAKGCNHE